MLTALLGKRATALYLSVIAVVSVFCGLALDSFYAASGISPQAVMGQAGEILPMWLKTGGTVLLLACSVLLVFVFLRQKLDAGKRQCECGCATQKQ